LHGDNCARVVVQLILEHALNNIHYNHRYGC